MTEQDIINLIKNDPWMMHVLRIADKLNLKDWAIGAGFVRNKVWDHLHNISNEKVDTPDVDLVYFDPEGNDEQADKILSEKLEKETGIKWEIVNQVYANAWNNIPPYLSTEDAISKWPETVTAVGVTIEDKELKLVMPYGIGDLVNLVIRPSPKFPGDRRIVKTRVEKKQWLKKWPKLKVQE